MQHLSDFGYLLLFIIGGLLFIAAGLFAASLIRPQRPNPEKLAAYECGEDPIGPAKGAFNMRFYPIAILFVLFEVELVFLFPWATVFGKPSWIRETQGLWGWMAFGEMAVFVALLALGLVYAWREGMLEWVRPAPPRPTPQGQSPPKRLYDAFNQRQQRAPQASAEKPKARRGL
jgi:NADH-quinone oxidoreductase subunit A